MGRVESRLWAILGGRCRLYVGGSGRGCLIVSPVPGMSGGGSLPVRLFFWPAVFRSDQGMKMEEQSQGDPPRQKKRLTLMTPPPSPRSPKP